MSFKTDQEKFWADEFGNRYTERINDEYTTQTGQKRYRLSNNIALFSQILRRTKNVRSVIEFGANIGLNLKAIMKLLPNADLSALEINKKAAMELQSWDEISKVYNMSILDFKPDFTRDFALTKGLLIHIDPNILPMVYDLLYRSVNKYLCIIEYYNPQPISIPYGGHDDRLFKRDFAGELLDRFEDLSLLDYGFAYHRDQNFPQDDVTWFLLEKA